MPAGLAAGSQVVQASIMGLAQALADRVSGDVCDQLGTRRCAKLVVDDGQAFALLGQAQHGFGEVGAARGIDPAGAKNQVLRTGGLDQPLAFELGATIDA